MNATRKIFGDLQSLILDVSNRVLPSVVHVEAIIKKNGRSAKVTGSGFIIDSAGYVITNHHVVEHAQRVEIRLKGRKGTLVAHVVGTDQLTDIALLKLPDRKADYPAASLGNEDKLRVGDWVLAVGNPYGLDGTVSFGIVSAKGRNLEQGPLINDFIQTDAMIDFGSSGGPLVNLDGQVVGVNSMGQGRGIGFTIPISTVRDVAGKLRRGHVRRGWFGAVVQPLDRDLADYFRKPKLTGVIVAQVLADSPAEKAGVVVGDIVTRFNGVGVEAEQEKDLNTFRRLVAGSRPGKRVKVELLRDLKAKTITVEVGEQALVDGAELETRFGFTVEEVTVSKRLRYRLSSSRGVLVSFVERGSPASEAGLEEGDVVIGLNDHTIAGFSEFKKLIERLPDGRSFMVRVRRGDASYLFVVRPFKEASNHD